MNIVVDGFALWGLFCALVIGFFLLAVTVEAIATKKPRVNRQYQPNRKARRLQQKWSNLEVSQR